MSVASSAALPSLFAVAGVGVDRLAFTGLLALRIATTFLMTPVIYAMPLPASARVLLVATLSIALAAGFPTTLGQWSGWSDFLQAAMAELALGITLGLGILLAFAAFSIAGQMLDVQLGFGMAQIVDPITKRPVPILTSAFEYLGALVFFLVNGPHALLRGLQFSLERFPVGVPWSVANAVGPVLKQAGGLFGLGFALAAPLVFCILLVEFVLAVVARNLPQMNMFTMGIPIKIVVGLIALSLWFTGAGGVMTRAYAGITDTWSDIFVAAEQVR